jgi:hypothetical protein
MINQKEISIEWINAVSKANRNVDKILVEKVIRALLLVEGLVKLKLSFVFKGGTALMLHLNTTKRLSIDIDIVLPSRPINLETILEQIAKKQGFSQIEIQNRSRTSKIFKEHFKFYYTPHHKTKKEQEFILLDLVYEKINYDRLISIPIQSSFIPIKGKPLTVKTPCFEGILGDKLTAFAPNTTGIPYFKKEDSMSMEIIKQMYDIGNLFDVVDDLKIIKSTFIRFAKAELTYRNLIGVNEADVLEDILQTALCLVSKGALGKGKFEQLSQGIRRVSGFIFSESFHLEKAILHATKTAYISTLLTHDASFIEKFNDPLITKDWFIVDPNYSKLNKLKKHNPEAFYYWYKIFQLRAIKI